MATRVRRFALMKYEQKPAITRQFVVTSGSLGTVAVYSLQTLARPLSEQFDRRIRLPDGTERRACVTRINLRPARAQTRSRMDGKNRFRLAERLLITCRV